MSTLSVNNVTEVGGAPVITSGVLDSGSLPAGSVLQVVSNWDATQFTSSLSSYTDVTGWTATITPSSASNKILVMATCPQISGSTSSTRNVMELSRSISGSSLGLLNLAYQNDADFDGTASVDYVDSPGVTTPVTYTMRVDVNGGGSVTIDRRNIVLMEIAV